MSGRSELFSPQTIYNIFNLKSTGPSPQSLQIQSQPAAGFGPLMQWRSHHNYSNNYVPD